MRFANAKIFLWILLSSSALSLVIPNVIAAQEKGAFAWKDGGGNVRTEKELKELLAQHKIWLQTKGKSGHQVILSDADLTNANLPNTDLTQTQLMRTNLTGANLHGSIFKDENTIFSVELDRADLSHSTLFGVRLDDVKLNQTDLDHAIFEPAANPRPQEIAKAKNIEFLTYQNNPAPLALLRKSFKDGGFREEERKLTYALKKREAEFLIDSCIHGKVLNCVEYWFNTIFFDWTTQYGMSPGRPVRLLFFLGVVCMILYSLFIYLSNSSGLVVVLPSHASHSAPSWMKQILVGSAMHGEYPVKPQPLAALAGTNIFYRIVKRHLPIIGVALFFSLMSAFNIGFRDINFGRWLRLLTTREYDFKAVGWARTVSGFQSLISVYFVAIWLLTYFGRPFE